MTKKSEFKTKIHSKKCLHTGQLAHTTTAYLGFFSTKGLAVLLLPLDGMLAHRGNPNGHSISSCFPDSSPVPIYIPGWREAL